MFSKPLAFGLLAAGCLTAAAGGAYVAVRSAANRAPSAEISAPVTPVSTPAPVAETEAAVTPAPTPSVAEPAPPKRPSPSPKIDDDPAPKPAPSRKSPAKPAVARTTPPRQPEVTSSWPTRRPAESVPESAPAVPESIPAPVALPIPEPAPELPAPRLYDELVVPASSVIGLQVETTLSSERAQIEDRVDARVARDVYVDGRVAIPQGSRVIGAVTLVDRGGKVKERARLGLRFHTLVLADGSELPLRTEAIFREGDPPSDESAKKIGGAAIGGAILGAILGGGKGAAIGGAAGAGAGTAAVRAGGRNPATLPAGTIVTARLSSPVAIQVER
ncbi:MAG TPA: TrbI/VirB10 family protein [Vicinamibacterales bacterium]|nr:TrbI/VirB10 family protein [Vicinamibacterales bacterium]